MPKEVLRADSSMPRFRPRISLLSALLLMTIAGMAIVIVQLWRELVPLRQEVRGYRTELGLLTIDDPTRIHGVQVPTREEGWKWRVYFPPGSDYMLHCFTGIIPAGVESSQRRDFSSMKIGPGGFLTSMGGNFEGESVIEARFKQSDGTWTLQISINGGGWSDMRLDKDFAAYLSNPRGALFWTSNFNKKEQSTFSADERVFLLKRRKPEVTDIQGGILSREPDGPAPGVALWIEPE
jgi:hypothetical protein